MYSPHAPRGILHKRSNGHVIVMLSCLRLCRQSPISLQRTLHDVYDTTSRTARTRYTQDSGTGVWAEKIPSSSSRRRRRLKDQDFMDHIIITVAAGKGGNGCVAFHRPSSPRAPRHPYRLGPPSGGNGGRGGDIYLLPDESLTSLASVPRRVKSKPGSNGSGEWRNGKKGDDKVVRVPMGTVVRVVGWGRRPFQGQQYAFGDVGRSEGTDTTEQVKWVHYPGWAKANVTREEFLQAEKWLEKEERRRLMEGKRKWGPWVKEGREIDLDAELGVEEEVVDTVNEPLGKKRKEPMGYLFASGGTGGLGNPYFSANLNTSTSASPSAAAFARSPKFASRGVEGDFFTLSLELKTTADVALVGRCSVGKSTLIRALTGGRVKSDVGGWEGVTRGVVRGVVRIAQGESEEQGVWEGELGGVRVFDESMEVEGRKRQVEVDDDEDEDEDEEFSSVPTKPGHGFDRYESFRFTITDNPGFVLPQTNGNRERQPEEKPTLEEQEELAPITQTILRSIERAKVLVYVVDLSGDAPWNEMSDVMKEVARGRGEGKSKSQGKTRKTLVVANKADLLVGSEGTEAEVAEAQAKLRRLEEYVKHEMGDEAADGLLEVVPVSAKWGMNLGRVVKSLERLLKGVN